MTAQIHKKIHCKFEAKYSHIDLKDPVYPPIVVAEIYTCLVDYIDPELAQDPNARPRQAIDRRLHQRDEKELRHEERECAERHPRVEMDEISEHRGQDATLQERLGDAAADE